MNKYLTLGALIISIFLAIITRFYELGEAPAGLYLDEAAQGYNAYSILKTGKDEFGKSFPIVFRSFADFKTPIYIYLIVPLIPLFGLTKFTVRLPSFIFSILTFPILYLLIKEVAPKRYALSLSLLTIAILSISPWHILFGRTAFECNIALFFFLSGIYFFYVGLKSPKNLLFSAVFFSIAITSYHAQRVLTPIMLVLLFLRYRKIILGQTHKKYLIIGITLGLLLLLPTISIATTPGFLARVTGLNIFSYSRQLPAGFLEDYDGSLEFLVNNKFFLTTREFSSLYLSYFSPRNMFFLGDPDARSSFPYLGTFFLWQFPFYVYGLYVLVKKNLGELKFLTLSLLLISPLPAAITRDPYSTIRSLQMVIPLTVIISFALIEAYQNVSQLFIYRFRLLGKSLLNLITFAALTTILIYSLARLYSSAIILNEYDHAAEWGYGYQQVADSFQNLDQKLPIVVDNTRIESYSELLFFLKFDPEIYQKENFEVSASEYYTNLERNKVKKIGRIITRPIDWEKDLNVEQYLVGDSLAVSYEQIKSHNLTLIDEIKYPDSSIAFTIVKTNPK
ncbi:hypothetical protein A3A75_01785 [Candidatus Woesebacteria bacterium RIFCSPLOWO2_01_FULL_39_10]|uniref:Glycosyltransferase RgtA/B/C/D-like domain-containing protein n=1 Tax=Candidatus Woesebacteria bacterium RIFCSPLOWO2_01_FULL_39_10 TaxID=1802516 RepID=A0A1F8B7W2_9BACT|nr:MAG: hypothetical protein A3A75_01785 [Candidatus Woesebacteria bacterium RIFCSPLOWO2_01_FULL_39_10]